MSELKTLDDALALVPENMLLRPGVDVLMKGDRFPSGLGDGGRMVWHTIMPEIIGTIVPHGYQIWARPIPQEVRLRAAKNILRHANLRSVKTKKPPRLGIFESWLFSQGVQ